MAGYFVVGEKETIRAPKLNAVAGRVSALEAGGGASGVSSFNTRAGAVTLTSGDVTAALTYTPVNPASLATVATSGAYGDLAGRPSLAAVATSGSAGDLSTGTLPAGRFPALTGDVTTIAGALGATIAAKAVSLAKMADMATSSLIYRKTAGSGAPEVNTLATLKSDLGLTGTNSGDQTITLTGDVSGSGTGSFAASIGANRVTRGMLAAAAGATILGATAAGNVVDLTAAQAKTFLAISSSDVSGLAAIATSGSGADLTANSVALGKLATQADQTILGNNAGSTAAPTALAAATVKTMLNLSGTNSGDQTITLTGNVTGSGTNSFATTIAASAVTRAMMANTAAATVLGSTAAGAVAELTAAQGRTVLGLATVASSGLASDLTGTLAAAQMPALTGDVTTSSGAVATTLVTNIVTYAKFQQVAASSLVGNATGSLANATGITLAGGLAFSASTLTAAGPLTPTSVASTGTISGTDITASGIIYYKQPAPTALAASATLTIAQLLTGIVTSTSASAVALTLPTGTLADAGIQSGALAVDRGFDWAIINLGSSSGAVTLGAGTGHTIVGNAVTAISTSSRWLTRKTATNTFITYRIA